MDIIKDDKGISKELMLRNNNTGRFIKRSNEELSLSNNFIPNMFFQVTNNKIYYADTDLIISEFLKNRNKEKNEFLETKYNNILDFLDNTRTYSSSFQKVFDECESNANDFDNEIRKLANGNISPDIKSADTARLLNTVNAYIKILFAYLYSAFALHKERVKNESVIHGKIQNLKSYIQDVLEKTLLPNDRWGKPNYKLSLYPIFIYSDRLNIKYIDVLVRYDRRFKNFNSLDVVRIVNSSALKISSGNYSSNIEFHGEFERMDEKHPSIEFIVALIELLGDIDRLENIRKEIGSIDDARILEEFDAHTKK